MSYMELLGASESENLTKQKWKQYCGTPCISIENLLIGHYVVNGAWGSWTDCEITTLQAYQSVFLDHGSMCGILHFKSM